jgi:hypothetical protein
MNYGHHVRDLLLELQRGSVSGGSSSFDSPSQRILPCYNDAGVEAALQDMKLHVQALEDQVQANNNNNNNDTTSHEKPSLAVRPSILLQNAACQRNKRGLLIYHWVRLQRIQEYYYWQSQPLFPTTSTENPLCPAEMEFIEIYEDIVHRYMDRALTSTTTGRRISVDLRAHGTNPPLPIDRVLVRVMDCSPFGSGDDDDETVAATAAPIVVLESGQTVTFTMGSTHYLAYNDCEQYIRSGALQLLGTEELE